MLFGEFVVVIALLSDIGCELYHIYVKISHRCVQGLQEYRLVFRSPSVLNGVVEFEFRL